MRFSTQCLSHSKGSVNGAPLFLSLVTLHSGRLRHSVQKVLKAARRKERAGAGNLLTHQNLGSVMIPLDGLEQAPALRVSLASSVTWG